MSCRKNKNECTPPRCKWIVGKGCRVQTPIHRQSPACTSRRKNECTPPCTWYKSRCRSPQFVIPEENKEVEVKQRDPCRRSLKRNCVAPCEWIVGTGCVSPRERELSVPLTVSSDQSLLELSVNADFTVVLRDFQQRAVDHMRTHDRLAIVFPTGMGKTLTANAIALEYLQDNPDSGVIVVSPKSVLDNFGQQLYEHYGIVNHPRIEYLSYGRFHNKVKAQPRFCDNKMLILDEAHNLRNPKGKKLESALKCGSRSSKRVLLTATPFVNNIKDLGTILSLLEGRPEYMNITYVEELQGEVIYVPKVNDPRFFPTVSEHKTYITMTAALQKQIETQLDSLYHDPEVFYNGYRRVVNGLKEADDYISAKMPFVMRTILADRSKKNLIYSNWLKQGVSIVETELEDNGVSFTTIIGGDSVKDRNESVREFNENKVNTLVISNAGSEGLDLKGVENVFVIDPPWNPAGIDQVIGRAIRYNSHEGMPENKRHVNIYYLILQQPEGSERTISGDVLLYNIIERKRTEQNKIMDALARISI